MKQFKIAIVGCGGVSRMHFETYLQHTDRIQIVAVCDADSRRLEQVRNEYGIENGFVSVEDMLAQTTWEVAVVCTPTTVRRPVVETLAAAGKHIMVEKPFADTYAEAQEMVNACQKAEVKLAVNQNFRYHYPFEIVREIVTRGTIGRVVSVVHQDLMLRHDSGWRTQTTRHALAVMGVHWLDGFRRMLDDEATTLACQTRRSGVIQSEGESDASVQLTFKKGTVVSYIESFSSSFSRVETLLIGTKGSLLISNDTVSLFKIDEPRKVQKEWLNPYSGANKPEATFISLNQLFKAIEEGREAPNSGLDNLKTIALLDGAYQSAEEKRIVTIQERD